MLHLQTESHHGHFGIEKNTPDMIGPHYVQLNLIQNPSYNRRYESFTKDVYVQNYSGGLVLRQSPKIPIVNITTTKEKK